MVLQSPLTVHVAGGGVEQHLDASDLGFTRTARGGFESATFTLPVWVDSDDLALAPVSRVMVDDGRNGARLFEGFLDIAGKTVDDGGHTWQIGAVGAQSVLADRSKAYVSINTDLTVWKQGVVTKPAMTAEPGSIPDTEDDALVIAFPRGIAVAAGSKATAHFAMLVDSGQLIGGFSYGPVSGVTDTDWRTEAIASGGGGGEETVRFNNFNTSASASSSRECGTDFATDRTTLRIRGRKEAAGATNITSDDYWTAATDVRVSAQRRSLTGAAITGSVYANEYVLAHEVVIDALWWFTNQIDIPGASIDQTFAYQIEHLAYPDGVRLTDVLGDLSLFEPDMVWEVGESNAAGLHRFSLRKWPTDVRYEADTSDGWSAPGGEEQLANSVRVYYTDRRGAPQSVVVDLASVPALDQWSRIRDAEPVELGAEMGGIGAATRVGEQTLAQVNTLPDAGTLTVARPIIDLYTGRSVMPWEIEPGYLVSVRDIDAEPMQLTEMSYRDSDQSATLTLGTPTLTTDQMVARLAKKRIRRGGSALPVR